MTRKDYVLIAEAVQRTFKACGGVPGTTHPLAVGVARTASGIADALALDNPRFDRGRFLVACGVAK